MHSVRPRPTQISVLTGHLDGSTGMLGKNPLSPSAIQPSCFLKRAQMRKRTGPAFWLAKIQPHLLPSRISAEVAVIDTQMQTERPYPTKPPPYWNICKALSIPLNSARNTKVLPVSYVRAPFVQAPEPSRSDIDRELREHRSARAAMGMQKPVAFRGASSGASRRSAAEAAGDGPVKTLHPITGPVERLLHRSIGSADR